MKYTRLKKPIGVKERQFVEEYLRNGHNGRAAVLKIWDYTQKAAGVHASRLLHNPRISNYMRIRAEEIADKAIAMGITPEYLLANYKQAIDKASENIAEGKRLTSQASVIKDMAAGIKDMTAWGNNGKLDITAMDVTNQSDNAATTTILDFKTKYLSTPEGD